MAFSNCKHKIWRYGRLHIPGLEYDQEMPTDIAEIIKSYEMMSEAFKIEAAKLTDEEFLEEINGFGGPVARGSFYVH